MSGTSPTESYGCQSSAPSSWSLFYTYCNKISRLKAAKIFHHEQFALALWYITEWHDYLISFSVSVQTPHIYYC